MKKWCEPKWRKPEDTDFSGIQCYEVVAASLWEMLRALSPDKLKSIGGIHGAAALRMLEWAPMMENDGRSPTTRRQRALRKSWEELDPAHQVVLSFATSDTAAFVTEGDELAKKHETMNPAAQHPALSFLDYVAGGAKPVPPGPDYRWNLSANPKRAAVQRVGLTIDWSKGMTLIREELWGWLQKNAPAGTPGTNGVPDPKQPAKGRKTDKPFRATLEWISYVRRLEMGEKVAEIGCKNGLYPSESTVRQARKNLARRYREWLGVTF